MFPFEYPISNFLNWSWCPYRHSFHFNAMNHATNTTNYLVLSCFVSFNKKLIQDVTLWKILATGAEHLGISITKMFKFFEFPILTGATLIEFFQNLQQVFGFGTIKLFQRLLKGSALFVNLSPNFLYVDLFRSIPKMNFHFFKYSQINKIWYIFIFLN